MAFRECRGARGKIVALRALNGPRREVTPADPPAVRRAWEDSTSAMTMWRLFYRMPPNDPRVQDVTEEEVLHDLLVLEFVKWRELPSTRRMMMDPKARAEFGQQGRRFLASDALKRAMRRIRKGGRTIRRAPPLRMTLPGRKEQHE